MKPLLICLLFGIAFKSFGQTNDQESESDPQKLYITYHLSIGGILVPEEGSFAASFNIQFQKDAFQGLGLDLTKASYKATSLNENPPFSEINSFDPQTDSPLPKLKVRGDDMDDFTAISPYYLRVFSINEKLRLNLKAGPSFIFLNKKEFEYSYSPGNPGTFAGGGTPPSLTANSSDSTEFMFGGYFRIAAQYKVSRGFAFEVSPFANFNGTQTIVGMQAGVALGSGY